MYFLLLPCYYFTFYTNVIFTKFNIWGYISTQISVCWAIHTASHSCYFATVTAYLVLPDF
jgi:hypothetical protein